VTPAEIVEVLHYVRQERIAAHVRELAALIAEHAWTERRDAGDVAAVVAAGLPGEARRAAEAFRARREAP
jgi:ATP-dependent helicase YprA (DUF1998 family)